ncbi:hypothetical protein M9H77_08371 [Catharanthus roseus]|uniref:Uncharacterized protein n=1 Tax=Catharanthus roseus TaxID=4058 RepID=A0ACC0BXR1_CATRO|nr:hypothetical protein M9H77_08371 [Catharanthus roseus]
MGVCRTRRRDDATEADVVGNSFSTSPVLLQLFFNFKEKGVFLVKIIKDGLIVELNNEVTNMVMICLQKFVLKSGNVLKKNFKIMKHLQVVLTLVLSYLRSSFFYRAQSVISRFSTTFALISSALIEEVLGRCWDGLVYTENRRALFAKMLSTLESNATAGDYGSVFQTVSDM